MWINKIIGVMSVAVVLITLVRMIRKKLKTFGMVRFHENYLYIILPRVRGNSWSVNLKYH